jgi:hypothetical protein
VPPPNEKGPGLSAPGLPLVPARNRKAQLSEESRLLPLVASREACSYATPRRNRHQRCRRFRTYLTNRPPVLNRGTSNAAVYNGRSPSRRFSLPCLLRRLANEARVALDGPRPSPELGTIAATLEPPSSSPVVPSPCHSQHDATGSPRSTTDTHGLLTCDRPITGARQHEW